MGKFSEREEIKTLTREQAFHLLEQAVDAKGDEYVDENAVSDGGCRYFNPTTGEAECIVGHVLAALGFSYDDFPDRAAYQDDPHIGPRDQTGTVGVVIGYDHPAYPLLSVAQNAQDLGETWGTALGTARDLLDHPDAIRPAVY